MKAFPLTTSADNVTIPAGRVELEGNLQIPDTPAGIVLFAHGSGSSRFSPRNQRVATSLNKAGLGTLLVDLLTRQEEAIDSATGHLRFDIDFLAERLMFAVDWLQNREMTSAMRVGLFGSSTGAAAALVAAGNRHENVHAVVSRGGRPDLAAPVLHKVVCPTLLIVGGHDYPVMEMNREALELLQCPKALEVVPGATHLFEEPGALEEVAHLARSWFRRFLATPVEGSLRSDEKSRE